MDQAVAIALRESPVLRGAVQEVAMAAGRVDAARAERRPWVALHAFAGGGSAPSIVDSTAPVQPQATMPLPGGRFFDGNVTLMAPLFTGSRLQSRVRQAQALREASQADLAATRQDLALTVRLAYREVQARRSLVRVYEAALDQSKERLRIDQVAYEQEKIPRFYLLRNQAEVANAEQLLTSATRDLEVSRIQLKTAMGVSLDSRLELTEPLEFRSSSSILAAYGLPGPAGNGAPVSSADAELARLVSLAEANRPELAAALHRTDAGRQEVSVARSAYKPQISAGVMGDVTKSGGESPFGGSTLAVVASLPLLDGGLRRANVRAAQAEAEKAQEERRQTALQVGREVATALLNLRAAESNVQTARSGLVAAEEEYRVALIRYAAGKGINVEALDAQTAQVRAQSNHVQALFEYHVAQDQLARALGMLQTPPARE
jgi:outer membrane protein TolC